MLLKIGALKNFENLNGKKPVLEALSKKVAGFLGTIFKKRLQHRRFPVKLAKFLKAPFFTKHLWWHNSLRTHNKSLIACNSHNDKLI